MTAASSSVASEAKSTEPETAASAMPRRYSTLREERPHARIAPGSAVRIRSAESSPVSASSLPRIASAARMASCCETTLRTSPPKRSPSHSSAGSVIRRTYSRNSGTRRQSARFSVSVILNFISQLCRSRNARRKILLRKGSFLLALFLFQTFLNCFVSIGKPIEAKQD